MDPVTSLLELNSSVFEVQPSFKTIDNLSARSYNVKKFELTKQLIVHVENFHLILPQRYSEIITNKDQVKVLNKTEFELECVKENNQVTIAFKQKSESPQMLPSTSQDVPRGEEKTGYDREYVNGLIEKLREDLNLK